MTTPPQLSFFERSLQEVLGQKTPIIGHRPVLGGDINDAAELHTSQGKFFIKYQNANYPDIFAKEAHGLSCLADSNTITIPDILGHGKIDNTYFLILDFIERGSPSRNFWESFGENLAMLHSCSSDKFGLEVDNYIGRLPQINEAQYDWVDFFYEHRIGYQVNYGIQNGLISSDIHDDIEKLYPKLSNIFPKAEPSLLHGDLWSGNFTCNQNSKPVIFDPAVYYGHREMEIAMTRLFGGFDLRFYQSYQANFPLEPGHEDRTDLCNLYPLLVHANLFGGSYLMSVKKVLKRFI
ncbi:MAG: fructosamine kinase family protein [Cyclobacteriaceae bacterium]